MSASQTARPLPPSTGSVEVQLLDGGSFTGNLDVVHARSPSVPYRCHSWAFYIHHKPSGRHLLWDVGLSADRTEFTAYNIRHSLDVLNPVSPRLSLPEQLRRRGIEADQVDTVLFSHHHWDHSRPVKGMFPKAVGYFGPGTFAHCSPGQFHDEPYHVNGKWDANFFHQENATENCAEVHGEWQRFGPFDKALDFLGDGSLWLLQAPGHMVGNMAAAARLSNGAWIVLASDCSHTKALLDGKEDFRTWEGPQGEVASLHEDLCATKDTVEKIRMLQADYGARVALAHDSSWMLSATDKVLMSLLDDEMRDFATNRLAK
ncbi:Uncharacterized protein TPAR_06261, partial [Tolypocladium paradoxum]